MDRAVYPRELARSRRFTLGVPRAFGFVNDTALRFVRSRGPYDPSNVLWHGVLEPDPQANDARARQGEASRTDGDVEVRPQWLAEDTAAAIVGVIDESVLADPVDLSSRLAGGRTGGAGEESEAEQARRQRARELATGITSYSQSRDGTLVAVSLEGSLWVLHDQGRGPQQIDVAGSAFDPRVSPHGDKIAVVVDKSLVLVERSWVAEVDTDRTATRREESTWTARRLADEPGVTWGMAEFVAAEEMGRTRGHWWSPSGRYVAACRVDERAVDTWYLVDPTYPDRPARPHRYPAAGRRNADVSLWLFDVEAGTRHQVSWDSGRMPYLTHVSFGRTAAGRDRLTLQVQTRDQRGVAILVVNPEDGATEIVYERNDEAPIELVAGSPSWWRDRLVTIEDDLSVGELGVRRLYVDGEPVTPATLQVRASIGVVAGNWVFRASDDDDPTSIHLWAIAPDGTCRPLTRGPGLFGAVAGNARLVVTAVTAHDDLPQVRVLQLGKGGAPTERSGSAPAAGRQGSRRGVSVVAAAPPVNPAPRMLQLGPRKLQAALYLPADATVRERAGESHRLPVVLDPYGGPHAQRVLAAGNSRSGHQWLADAGFAVLVIDGRGTPGRGPRWERAILGDLAGPVLDDQLDGLQAAAAIEPRLDLDRVGIRGWSFGGYLAGLAAIRAPHRIHAAIAGAPVTDWRLYDTHYTERYLGDPARSPEAYRAASLVDDAGLVLTDPSSTDGARQAAGHASAARTHGDSSRPPILIIHGLVDDNVVVAHSLRFVAALMAADWPHRFVPLTGVTHFATDEQSATAMLELEVAFLREHLKV